MSLLLICLTVFVTVVCALQWYGTREPHWGMVCVYGVLVGGMMASDEVRARRRTNPKGKSE